MHQVHLVQLLDRWLRLASSFSDGDGTDSAGGDGANEGSGSGHDRSLYKAGRAGGAHAGDDPRAAARALAMLESRALLPIPGGAMDATALRQLSQSAAVTVRRAFSADFAGSTMDHLLHPFLHPLIRERRFLHTPLAAALILRPTVLRYSLLPLDTNLAGRLRR